MKTPQNIIYNPIKKNIYSSINKKEISPSILQSMKIDIPSDTEKVLNICAKKHNGKSTNFYILKDRYGDNIGSRTLYSNGLMRSIDIKRYPVIWDRTLPLDIFNTMNTMYTNTLQLGKRILQETRTFSEVYHKYNPPLNSELQEKADSFKDLYHFMIKVKENFSRRGHRKISQEVLQIEGDKNPIMKFFKLDLQMKASGDTKINSYTHSKSVEMNKNNPYFALGLLRAKDMIKGRYRALAKENKMDGIEPPLYYDKVRKKELGPILGITPNDNSYVGINLSRAKDKIKLAKILGHECEHLFKQNVNIYLSGLKNTMSRRDTSKRFFKGIEKRFAPIKKDTQKYQDAEQCLYERNNLEDLVVTNGNFDVDKYNSLYKEESANLAGDIEGEDFKDYIKDLRQNFSLFNREYALKNDAY